MDFRKEAKESRAKKLHQLTVKAPDAKVDASGFTPYANPEMDQKTGKRPINPRAFKRGGKVAALDGGKAKKRGDRVGAKGRAKKMIGGDITAAGNSQIPSAKGQTSLLRKAVGLDYKTGGRAKKAYGGRGVGERTQTEESRRNAVKAAEDFGLDSRVSEDDLRKATRDYEQKKTETAYKKGGKVKKMNGGPMMAGPTATLMKRKTPMNNPAAKAPAVMPMRAKGGKVHDDEAMDKALIKKMVKPEARKCAGGRMKKASGGKTDYERALEDEGLEGNNDSLSHAIAEERAAEKNAYNKKHGVTELKKGGRTKKFGGGGLSLPAQAMANANPNAAFNQASIMPVSGPSMARGMRASGGRTKGKSNISIVIAPQTAQPQMPGAGMMPPRPMPMPLPPPPAGGAPAGMPPGAMPPGAMPPGAMGGALPMPMPPMGAGAPAPALQGVGVPGIPGMAPLPRKSGGRVKSFKDMTAGAGSGEGRLQKEEMQEYKRVGRKAGGSVPKMTAGAGSGPGRIEKIHAYGENPHGEAAPKPQKRKIV